MRIRVLVVEDDFVIALGICRRLADAGFEIVGPARSVANALRLVAKTGCDIAVLNVNLGNETSEPIARKLQECDKPFIVLSGYSTDNLPRSLSGATFLAKPAPMAELLAAVSSHVDATPKAGPIANP